LKHGHEFINDLCTNLYTCIIIGITGSDYMRRWMGLAIGAMLAISLAGTMTPKIVAGYDFIHTENAYLTSTIPYENTATISIGSSKVYDMTLQDGSDIKLSLDVSPGANFNFLLYNNAQSLLETSMGAPSGEEIDFTTNYAGTYYVVVECISGSGTYTFNAMYAGYNFNSPSSGLSIPGEISNQYLGTGDYKVYVVYITNSVATTFTLDGLSSGQNLDLFLYDSIKTEVWSSITSGAHETFTYTPSIGIYYVVVDAISGSGNFRLTTSTVSTPGNGDTTGFEKKTPGSVPWTVGDYVASGGYLDLADVINEMKAQMTENMTDVDATISGAGGIGQYILVEYMGENDGNYKFDYTCTIYLDVSGSANIKSTESDMSGTMKGDASVTVKLTYSGSLWLGYYENAARKAYWAGEKMTLNIVGSLDASVHADLDVTYNLATVSGTLDVGATADLDVGITLVATPGIPFLPAKDEDISVEKTCTVTYTGDVKFDMEATIDATGQLKDEMLGSNFTAPDPVHIDKAASGEFTDSYSLSYSADTHKATAPPLFNGGWAFITNVDEIDLSGIGGTRATGFETTATYDPSKGMYTTYDPYFGPADSMLGGLGGSLPVDIPTDTSSIDMTLEPVDKTDAESFNDNPSAFLSDQGVAMPGSSFPWLIVVLAIIAVAVVIVLVLVMLMMKKKKAAKFNQHPEPYQGQPYGQQPYQQPPQQQPQPYQPQQEQYPPQQPPQYPQQ
jgi:hypothetical protein